MNEAAKALGFAGCWLADRDESMERLSFQFPDAGSNLWMLVHADLRRNARVRAFVDYAHGAMKSMRSSFEVT